MKKRLIALRLLNWALFIATLLVGAGALVPSHLLPGSSVLAIILPIFTPLHLMAFVLFILKKPRFAVLNIIALALLYYPVMAQFPFAKAPESHNLKIASFNVRGFYQSRSAEADIAQWAKDEQIDILMLQEVHGRSLDKLLEVYPHRVYAPKWNSFSIAIFSKFPITDHQALEFESVEREGYTKKSALRADVQLGDQTVRILNVHLNSTGVRDGDMVLPEDREGIINKGTSLWNKLAQSDRARGPQGKEIVQWVKESPYPIILAGDFNSVPANATYAQLVQTLDDPYIQHGHGSMGSYIPLRRKWVPIRIDWTLCSPELPYNGQYIDEINLSDHRPLITTFSFPEDPRN